jgi:cell division protein ZapD
MPVNYFYAYYVSQAKQKMWWRITATFQQAPSGKVYQLMRIAVEDDALFSEISANKYLLSIRFMQADRDKKPQPANKDVPFKLTLCQF